jgi:uncharacterized Zn-binding protein involved in type VI secretion
MDLANHCAAFPGLSLLNTHLDVTVLRRGVGEVRVNTRAVQRLRRDADQSSPSTAEVKSAHSSIRVQGVLLIKHGHVYTFTFSITRRRERMTIHLSNQHEWHTDISCYK